jgi:hypothetical protein
MANAGNRVRHQAALLPAAPGVYRFRDASGRVLYLGRATHLRSRVASYWGDLRDRAHLAPMVSRVGAAAARRHLAATPPEWTAFAQRNAELAARLTRRQDKG